MALPNINNQRSTGLAVDPNMIPFEFGAGPTGVNTGPTQSQILGYNNSTPEQQAIFDSLTPAQRSQLANLTPGQRQGLQNLPPGGLQTPVPGQTPFQNTGIPPTGLIGSEQAITGGLDAQLGLISQGIGNAQGEIDLSTEQSRRDLLTGQAGGINALQTGATTSADILSGAGAMASGNVSRGFGNAIGSIQQGFNQAQQTLNPFTQTGTNANQLQSAQSGALGPEAQQQAFNAFVNSPGQQFAIEQGEQARIRNAAATGGLGGGNIQRELTRFGIGQAQQNFQQQFENLGSLGNLGAQTGGQQANLFARGGESVGNAQSTLGVNLGNIAQNTGINLSNVAGNLGTGQADIFGSTGANLANVTSQGGVNLSNLALQGGTLPAAAVGAAANTLSTGRFNTGVNLADAVSNIATGQAGLQGDLGAGLANQAGQGATNIGNLASGTGSASATLQQNMALALANSGIGVGSTAADFTNLAATFDAGGILGRSTAVQTSLGQLLQLLPQGGGGDGGSDTSGAAINDLINVGL